MERELPPIHPDGEHVPTREVLQAFPARAALRAIEASGVGAPSPRVEVPDLSMGPEYRRFLMRSGWSAAVYVDFKSELDRPAPLYGALGEKLVNRSFAIRTSPGLLKITFQVEDGSETVREEVAEFADALGQSLGDDVAGVESEVFPLDQAEIDQILAALRN